MACRSLGEVSILRTIPKRANCCKESGIPPRADHGHVCASMMSCRLCGLSGRPTSAITAAGNIVVLVSENNSALTESLIPTSSWNGAPRRRRPQPQCRWMVMRHAYPTSSHAHSLTSRIRRSQHRLGGGAVRRRRSSATPCVFIRNPRPATRFDRLGGDCGLSAA